MILKARDLLVAIGLMVLGVKAGFAALLKVGADLSVVAKWGSRAEVVKNSLWLVVAKALMRLLLKPVVAGEATLVLGVWLWARGLGLGAEVEVLVVLALALAPGLLRAVFGGVLMMSFSSPKVELLVGTVASVFVNSSKRDDDGEPGWLNESARARSWIWGLEMI